MMLNYVVYSVSYRVCFVNAKSPSLVPMRKSGEKRAVCVCSSPLAFRKFLWNMLCYTNIHAKADFSHVSSIQLFANRNHRCGRWPIQSFHLKFSDHLKQNNTDCYFESDVNYFRLQNRLYVSHRECNHVMWFFSKWTEIHHNFGVAE